MSQIPVALPAHHPTAFTTFGGRHNKSKVFLMYLQYCIGCALQGTSRKCLISGSHTGHKATWIHVASAGRRPRSSFRDSEVARHNGRLGPTRHVERHLISPELLAGRACSSPEKLRIFMPRTPVETWLNRQDQRRSGGSGKEAQMFFRTRITTSLSRCPWSQRTRNTFVVNGNRTCGNEEVRHGVRDSRGVHSARSSSNSTTPARLATNTPPPTQMNFGTSRLRYQVPSRR